jgi:hypothetical protein
MGRVTDADVARELRRKLQAAGVTMTLQVVDGRGVETLGTIGAVGQVLSGPDDEDGTDEPADPELARRREALRVAAERPDSEADRRARMERVRARLASKGVRP